MQNEVNISDPGSLTMTRRKIGIWGFFGTNNFGDDYLLQLLIRQIRQITDNPIYVFSSSSTSNGMECDVYHIPRSIKSSVMMAINLDTLIIGPGGLLPNRSPGKIVFFILLALLMRLRSKKVGIIGLGIGDANFSSSLTRWLLNVLFSVASTVIIRHSLDGKLILWKRNKKKVKTSLDYLLSSHDMFAEDNAKPRDGIVFSLADIFSDNEKEREVFVDGICLVIQRLLSRGIPVTLIGLTNATDSILNRIIVQRLGSNRVTCLTYGIDDTKDILASFSKASITVAMRFHALVLSLYNETPTYTIAYSDKLEWLCDQMGLEEYLQRICVDEKLYYEKIVRLDAHIMLTGLEKLAQESKTIRGCIHRQISDVKEDIDQCYNKGLREVLAEAL